jgi:hypothetical protein
MFDSICDTFGDLDLGAIAESMLFYQRVHLVLGVHRLRQLVGTLGARRLVDLVDQGHLQLHYTNTLYGGAHQDDRSGGVHNVVRIAAPGHELVKVLPSLVRENLRRRGPSADRCINKLLRAIQPLDIPDHLIEATRGSAEYRAQYSATPWRSAIASSSTGLREDGGRISS